MSDIYVNQAMTSLNAQPNPVLIHFFSDVNISYIQASLKKQVKKRIGHKIDDQSCNELYTIMKYFYVNNAKIVSNHEYEVSRLNELVLNDLVPMVSSNVLQHIQYIRDINTLPVPMNRGKPTTTKGDNSLELRTF